MVSPVLMPQIGQDIPTGTIQKWLVKENDEVKEGDIIAEVESEKAVFEVEAYESGVILKILYAEGEEVEVLKPIAYIGEQGEEIPEE
ncbi:biotin/lipoyl-containing protein [candidate division KSB1 bacterium]